MHSGGWSQEPSHLRLRLLCLFTCVAISCYFSLVTLARATSSPALPTLTAVGPVFHIALALWREDCGRRPRGGVGDLLGYLASPGGSDVFASWARGGRGWFG